MSRLLRWAAPLWARLTARPTLMASALVVLAVLTMLPGVVRLPAVDRTEVVFADTSGDMVQTGNWLDPRYRGDVHAFRPVGTYWAQGLAATIASGVAGEAALKSIITYRLPGFLAVVLAVLATFLLVRPVVGVATAALSAALFAVAPLTVLVAQLAIAEGLSLLPATVAMLVLLRIYTEPNRSSALQSRWLAVAFWAALGVGILINALLVPLLVAATLVALWVVDRDLSWLRRLSPGRGLVIAAVVASPWLIVRAYQDGIPFSGMDWSEWIEALTGSQDMKLRAWPGTFVLAAVVGFLPGTAMLPPAMLRLWHHRGSDGIARFLFAWIVGYLIFNEVFSSEPGTYTVQVIFPAMAIAVARLVMAHVEARPPPAYHLAAWPPLAALLALVLLGGIYGFTGIWPTWPAALAILLTAALFAWSAAFARQGLLKLWSATGVGALATFAVTLLAVILPRIDSLWPAREITRAIAGCPPATISLAGFREPSGKFVTGAADMAPADIARTLGEKTPRLTIVEARAEPALMSALAAQGQRTLPSPSACVTVYNVMRGCPLSFRIYETGAGERCSFTDAYACARQPAPPPFAAKDCR